MSKHNKDKRKKRRQKSVKWRAPQPSERGIVERAASTMGVPPGKVVLMSQSGPKLSARLLELVQPEWNNARDDKGAQNLIGAAILAWNLALDPDEEREAEIADAAKKLSHCDPGRYAMIRGSLAVLVARKLALFPDDDRYVMEFDLYRTPGGWHLNVASLMPDNDA